MEDVTLAIVTLMSFVLLFAVAIFADRSGADLERVAAHDPIPAQPEPVVSVEESDAA